MAAVLLVCTANICRSPMAEAIKARLGEVFKTIASAGVHADRAAARWTRAPQRRWPGTTTRWSARALAPRRPEQLGHDLVLAMEAEHVEALRKAAPSTRPAS
jgi:protein-tyrosine phosphatase